MMGNVGQSLLKVDICLSQTQGKITLNVGEVGNIHKFLILSGSLETVNPERFEAELIMNISLLLNSSMPMNIYLFHYVKASGRAIWKLFS